MNSIYKYVLNENVEQEVTMLPGKILSVGAQSGCLCVWALVQTDQPPIKRKFRVFGNGWPCENPGTFLGTVQGFDQLVWHVFYE